MAYREWGCLVVAACASPTLGLLVPAASFAQEANGAYIETLAPESNAIDSSSYDRGRNLSVRERPRPDYEAVGIHAGGFMIYPKITVTGAYDDNIYAVQSGAVGDFILDVSPEIDIQSNWSRNALTGYARVSQSEYASYSGEDSTQYATGVSGKYEFGQSDLTGGVDYGHYVLPRSASNNIGFSVHPIQYDYTGANVQFAHEFTRVRISVRADDQIYDYQNGLTSAGAVVFDRDQNRNVATLTAKGEVAVSPDAAVYVSAAGNDRQYDLNPPQVAFTRNSTGFEVDAGANFDLTHLVRGEVQFGYLDQDYQSPLFRPIRGPSGKIQFEWFPTQLTTVTLLGMRAVGDAGVPGSAGYLTTDGSAQIDHELLRNLILSGSVWIGHDQYNGIDRHDQRAGAGLSADWLLTRHVGLTLSYNYTSQQSSGADRGPSFNDNRVSLAVVLQL